MIEDLKTPTDTNSGHAQFPLSRNNCILIIISLILIIIGFVLMAGSPSTVTEYNPDIFSDRRIVVGPLLSFVGFVLMAVAIIVKPKRS